MYVPSAPDVFLTIIAGIWVVIALVSLLRLLPGLRAVYALRDGCRPCPSSLESRLPLWLEAKARGRRTQLMICDAAPGATVLGFDRPCIAIPSSLVDALTIDELDQVILHEHAHAQRRDDWSRLAQTLLVSVLWIHPAALFMSRALNREREMACDEWVVARTGLPKAYARCLAHAAAVRMRERGTSRLVPALLGRRHELARRVDRLLAIQGKARRNVSLGAAALAACAMVMVSVQLQEARFAEIAEIVLPKVSVPIKSVYNAAIAPADTPVTVRLAPIAVRLKPDTTYEGPDASAFAAEPQIAAADKLDAPSLSARAFPGTYAVAAPGAPLASVFAPESHIASADRPNAPSVGWRAIATPGVEMASAAKRTSIGIASVFSRAGVSLARSF